jgi:lipopolysaccharide/colanic/teichoic acid biosynthesis glycosyltransferase
MEELINKAQSTVIERWGVQKQDHSRLYIDVKTNRYIKAKYFFEYVAALFTVLLMSPFLAVVGLLIKINSPGPVLFKQRRYGLSGMPFEVYKFRTMIDGAHALQHKYSHLNEMEGGKLFKSDNDPRVTKFGKFLRKTSIDELPQLLNILKGQMSIIGPRPISTPLEEYDEEDLVRFKVKPGLGCIWQAYFRKETDFKSWMKTDALYVENISLWLDIKLFFTITINVFKGKGAR